MNYRHLALRCGCGELPQNLAEVGFSDDHQLVVHWWCERCHRLVYATKPLADCWRDCPSPEESLERRLEELDRLGYASGDACFLRSVGVLVS